MSSSQPIGIFDSGVGGLSVLTHIRRQLPAEDLIYVADTAHLPYGSKNPNSVRLRSSAITEFLMEQGIKALVVACNTATAASVAMLRNHYKIPIIGMEPGIKPGIEQSKSGKVAILATDGTLGSEKFRELMHRFAHLASTIVAPCPGWVELVEQRHPSPADPDELITKALQPLLDQGVDTLVLGCTHYPFLKQRIASITQGKTLIIDTGDAVAKQLRRRLAAENLLNLGDKPGTEQFWSSEPNPDTERIVAKLWGGACRLKRLPEWVIRS